MTRKTYPNFNEEIEIAKRLETSAEYLVTGVEPKDFDSLEIELIDAYRKLNAADQENVLLAVKAWLRKNEQ